MKLNNIFMGVAFASVFLVVLGIVYPVIKGHFYLSKVASFEKEVRIELTPQQLIHYDDIRKLNISREEAKAYALMPEKYQKRYKNRKLDEEAKRFQSEHLEASLRHAARERAISRAVPGGLYLVYRTYKRGVTGSAFSDYKHASVRLARACQDGIITHNDFCREVYGSVQALREAGAFH